MKRSEVAMLVAELMQAYPQSQTGPATSAIYERELEDLDRALALDAVRRLVRTSKWLPTIAEIRAAAVEVRNGPKRPAVEAWGDVVAAIRFVGSYQPEPPFADPLVAEAVRLMGWRNLCLGDNDVADRARFCELYDGLQTRERVEVAAGSMRALPAPRSPLQLPPDVAAKLAGILEGP